MKYYNAGGIFKCSADYGKRRIKEKSAKEQGKQQGSFTAKVI